MYRAVPGVQHALDRDGIRSCAARNRRMHGSVRAWSRVGQRKECRWLCDSDHTCMYARSRFLRSSRDTIREDMCFLVEEARSYGMCTNTP